MLRLLDILAAWLEARSLQHKEERVPSLLLIKLPNETSEFHGTGNCDLNKISLHGKGVTSLVGCGSRFENGSNSTYLHWQRPYNLITWLRRESPRDNQQSLVECQCIFYLKFPTPIMLMRPQPGLPNGPNEPQCTQHLLCLTGYLQFFGKVFFFFSLDPV